MSVLQRMAQRPPADAARGSRRRGGPADSPLLAAGGPPAGDDHRRAAEVDAIVRHGPGAMAFSGIGALALAALHWTEVDGVVLSVWLAATLFASLVCARAMWRQRRVEAGEWKGRGRRAWAAPLAGALGFCWGAAGIVFLADMARLEPMAAASLGGEVTTLAILAGAAAAAMPLLAMVPAAHWLFTVSALAPPAVALAFLRHEPAWALAVLTCLYAAWLLRAARRWRATFEERARLTVEKDALVSRLSFDRRRADQLTAELEGAQHELLHRIEERAADLRNAVIRCKREIAQRREIDSRLRQEQMRFEAVFDHVPDAMILVDSERKILLSNPAVQRIFGYRREEIIGVDAALLYEAGREFARRDHGPFFADPRGTVTPCFVNLRRKGGELFPGELIGVPIKDPAGRSVSYLGILRDLSHRRAAAETVEFLSQHDVLTGLPNRALFRDRLAVAFAQAMRHGDKVAVLLLDIDDFKSVNDALGDSAGDRLIEAFARRLSECARGEDTVARLGGDEFAVIQARLDSALDAGLVAQRIIAALSEPVRIGGRKACAQASIGISIFPDDGNDISRLINNAELALARAKEHERGRFVFYSHEMGERAGRRLDILAGLREALSDHQFALHFQPKVGLSSGEVVGSEALLRWHHPAHGMVSPAEFIPVAESTGLIFPIGTWVLDGACTQLRHWARVGLPPLPVSVNLSVAQFRDRELVDRVRGALDGAQVDPQLIELEITETALMENADAASTILTELTALGVSLSIDDFGAGYSSLSYLKRFPVAKLKIDRTFIQDIERSRENQAITRAVIELGHNLDLSVIAEGVETAAQREILTTLGCDEIQGFLVSRPLLPGDFEREFDSFAGRVGSDRRTA